MIKLEIDLDELKIENFNSEHMQLIDGIETMLYKETQQFNKLVFYFEKLEDLNLVAEDLRNIIIELTLKIEEYEDELEEMRLEEERQSALDSATFDEKESIKEAI